MQLAEYTEVTSPDFKGDPGRPESWLARSGELLRELPGRRVFKAEIDGQSVVIKEFTPRGIRTFFRSYAKTEAEHARAARERGVPVVEPLAFARLRDGRQILVVKDEEGARSLHDIVLEGGVRGRRRHALAQEVGALFARMQNAGIRHRDPHAGNLLVRPDGTVLLGDAWALRPGDYLTIEERAAALAPFACFFLTHGVSRVDILLFLRAYGQAAGYGVPDLLRLLDLVAARLPKAFRKLADRRTRYARRMGRTVKAGTFEGFATEGIPDRALDEIVALSAPLREGSHVLKKSPTAWTLRAGDDLILKVYLPKKASRALRDFFRGTRAERALESAEAMLHRGYATPEVLATLRDTYLPGRSILVMRRAAGATLEEAVAAASPGGARVLAARLGRALRRMHDWGLRHRDLKKDNLLVARDGTFLFLDLDGVRQCAGPLDWGRRARDLANLAGSLLDFARVPTGLRLRALDAYLGGDVPAAYAGGAFTREVVRLAAEARARLLRQ